MSSWDSVKGEYVETPDEMKNFFDEIEAVCRKHGLSIGHEDSNGGFEIHRFRQEDITWLRGASKSY